MIMRCAVLLCQYIAKYIQAWPAYSSLMYLDPTLHKLLFVLVGR